ncbi:MAG: hypothetical protein PHI97_30335 [Desulfobulbus sp.]|nr:hypothetical protein [Desulfobulbus sp.]
MTCNCLKAKLGISPNLGRAARLPASAGAGLTWQGAWFPGFPHEAEGPREPSLTYEEIGQALCECVDAGIIDQQQARQIGNALFPPVENVS